MKVLISPVGKRDPWGTPGCRRPEPLAFGAALGIALHVQPELVFLLPTLDRLDVGHEHTMAEAEATKAALAELLPGTRVCLRPYDLGDPTDYGQVMPQTERLLRHILAELGQGEHEVAVNVSSGTPQIQASLQLAISAGLLAAKAYQAIDPRYLRTGQPAVREVAVRFWSEALALDRAQRLFAQSDYEACAREAEFLATSPQSERRQAAEHLKQLCGLYAAVHHIDYFGADQAARRLLKALEGVDAYRDAWPALARQADVLARLPKLHPKSKPGEGEQRETTEFLADLYHNAARCLARHNYADTLARVWRVLEGTLYLLLREGHGLEPTDVRASSNAALAEEVIAFLGQQQERKVEVTLGSALRLFAKCLDDPTYKAFHHAPFPGTQRRTGQVMDELREARNQSVVGHDSLPVSEERARQALALAAQALRALLPAIDLDGHPFAPTAVNAVGEVFFQALRRG